ncbi:hypothetical protein KST08_00740 [Fusobacterium animalis]|uniref:hypothetical protein n=1 Tax=Fusobacterium animalis TaxID=76859 RepID=UPI00324468AE
MVSIQILPIVNILLFLTLMKFSTVENLIKVKGTGDCNIVHTDCAISLETWSGKVLKNKPISDDSVMGTLITFNLARKVQLYVSASAMYSRINQGSEDYNSWLSWIKLS